MNTKRPLVTWWHIKSTHITITPSIQCPRWTPIRWEFLHVTASNWLCKENMISAVTTQSAYCFHQGFRRIWFNHRKRDKTNGRPKAQRYPNTNLQNPLCKFMYSSNLVMCIWQPLLRAISAPKLLKGNWPIKNSDWVSDARSCLIKCNGRNSKPGM